MKKKIILIIVCIAIYILISPVTKIEDQKIQQTEHLERPSIVFNTTQFFSNTNKKNLGHLNQILELCDVIRKSTLDVEIVSCKIKKVALNSYNLELDIKKSSKNLLLFQKFFYQKNKNEVKIKGTGKLSFKFKSFPTISEKYRFENKLIVIDREDDFGINFTGLVFTDSQNIFKLANLLQIDINSFANARMIYLFDKVIIN